MEKEVEENVGRETGRIGRKLRCIKKEQLGRDADVGRCGGWVEGYGDCRIMQ